MVYLLTLYVQKQVEVPSKEELPKYFRGVMRPELDALGYGVALEAVEEVPVETSTEEGL